MNGDPLAPPPPPPPPSPPAEPGPPGTAFWGFADVLLVFAAWFVAILTVSALLPQTPTASTALAGSAASYAAPFLLMVAIFRIQYHRRFWEAMAWFPVRIPPLWTVIGGWSAALAVNGLAYLIRLPNTPNPMTQLMQGRTSLILIGVFGVTLGPLAEELIFRGFLQPLLVRALGAAPGILIAAVPFGLLHFSEYGNSWRHAVLISGAGAAFGWMRHYTGSTKASTLMHAAYNLLFFAALLGGK
jgi:membrane protease YdiL (CAAX protease family)